MCVRPLQSGRIRRVGLGRGLGQCVRIPLPRIYLRCDRQEHRRPAPAPFNPVSVKVDGTNVVAQAAVVAAHEWSRHLAGGLRSVHGQGGVIRVGHRGSGCTFAGGPGW